MLIIDIDEWKGDLIIITIDEYPKYKKDFFLDSNPNALNLCGNLSEFALELKEDVEIVSNHD